MRASNEVEYWCLKKPIPTIKSRYIAGILLVILLIGISVTALVFPPRIDYVRAGELELIKVTFNKDPEEKPVSITALLKNSGGATVNLTSLWLETSTVRRFCTDTYPRLPLIIEPRGSVNITIMYEWCYESCFGISVEFPGGGCGWSVDTWTKPLFRWIVLREKGVLFVGEKIQFPVYLEHNNCPFGYGRSLMEVVGRVTAFVDVQNPRGDVERIKIFTELPRGGGATGDDLEYSFDEAGEWVLNFRAVSDNYGSLANYSMPIKVLDQGFNVAVRAFNKESCFIREVPYPLLNITDSYVEKFTRFYEGGKVWVYGNNTVDFKITVDWRKMPPCRGDLMVEVTDPATRKTTYYIENVQMNGSGTAESSWPFSIIKIGEWLFDFKLVACDTVSNHPVRIYANRAEISLNVETNKESYSAGEEVFVTINETWINVIREEPWSITYLIEIDMPPIDTGTGETLPWKITIEPGSYTYIGTGFGGARGSYKVSVGSFAVPGVYKLTAKLLANKRVIASATTEFIVKVIEY